MTETAMIQTILQVEDDEDILEITRLTLELSPETRLFQARNATEALQMLPDLHPDVILLDVMMPDADGPETLKRIRMAGFGSIPVIFLTARARGADLDELMQLGVAGVMVKPFDPITLLEQVRTIIECAYAQPA